LDRLGKLLSEGSAILKVYQGPTRVATVQEESNAKS
jgi:hypothetical protein